MGFAVLGLQLKNGVVAAGARETGRKKKPASIPASRPQAGFSWGTVVQRRELRLLSRYQLDPAASPPARVSTSDGVIAAMVFFVVQGIAAAIALHGSCRIGGGALTKVYSIAGASTFFLFRYIYWRSKTVGVPRILGEKVGRALIIGAVAGCVAAAGGVAYLHAVRASGIAQQQLLDSARGIAGSIWIPVLAIVAAPLFEEFIFRGLIFGGLKRSVGLAASIGAANCEVSHLRVLAAWRVSVCAAAYGRGGPIAATLADDQCNANRRSKSCEDPQRPR